MDPAERKKADDADEEAMKNMVWGKGLVQMEEKVALAKRCDVMPCGSGPPLSSPTLPASQLCFIRERAWVWRNETCR